MTSKNLSYKTLMRRNLSSRLWAVALSVLGCLGALLFPVFAYQQEFARVVEMNAKEQNSVLEGQLLARAEQDIYDVLSYDGIAIKLVLCTLAIVCGVALFRYLHDRKQVDFYHALPMNRGRLFLLNYISGPLLVLPVFLVVYAISLMTANGMGLGGRMTAEVVMQSVLGNIVYFFLNYTIAIFCTVLTGNTIITILLGIWVEFSVWIWRQMGDIWKSVYFTTYAHESAGAFEAGSPIMRYFFDTPGEHTMPFEAVQKTDFMIFITPVVWTIVFLVLSYVLFVRRKSERAGTAVAFEWMKAPICWYMSLFMGSGLALIFHAYFVQSEIWTWIGLILGIALSHAVVQIVYEFDFKAMFWHWKQIIVLCVVAGAALVGLRSDVFGYDRYLPRLEDIAAVSLNDSRLADYLYSRRVENELSDPESIRMVYEIAQKMVEHIDEPSEEEDWNGIYIGYTLKNGKCIARRYLINESWIGDTLAELETSETYIKKYDIIQQIQLPQDAPFGEFVLAVYPQMYHSQREQNMRLEDVKQIQSVIDTLAKERILNAKAHLNEIPVMGLEFLEWREYDRAQKPDRSVWLIGMLQKIPVYPSDTKTLELIQTLTGVVPGTPVAEQVNSLDILLRDDSLADAEDHVQGYKAITVTDPEILKQLSHDLYPEEQIRYAGKYVDQEQFADIDSFEIQSDTLGTAFCYPKGKAPIELLREITGLPLGTK